MNFFKNTDSGCRLDIAQAIANGLLISKLQTEKAT